MKALLLLAAVAATVATCSLLHPSSEAYPSNTGAFAEERAAKFLQRQKPHELEGAVNATLITVICPSPSGSPGPTPPNGSIVVYSLPEARDTARTIAGRVVINVTTDCYLNETLALSGAADSHTTWFTMNDAHIFGGPALKPSLWQVVGAAERAARGMQAALGPNVTVVKYPLSAVNLGPLGLGAYFNGGLGQCRQTRAELFVGRHPMTVARFPNAPLATGTPWMNWAHVREVSKAHPGAAPDCESTIASELRRTGLDRQHSDASNNCRLRESPYGRNAASTDLPSSSFTTFDIPVDVAQRLAATPPAEQARGWMHGYWAFDWADNYVNVRNMTLGGLGGTNLTVEYNPKTPPVYRVESKARFYVTNFKSELDQAGEYYFDEDANEILFVANETVDPRTAPAFVSTTLNAVMGTDLEDVMFYGLQFAYFRGTALAFENSRNVTTWKVEAKNLGWAGVTMYNAANSTIYDTKVEYAGCHAMSMSGGDEATLESSGNQVIKSKAKVYARWTRTYNPGLSFSGVDVLVYKNKFEHAPHNGLQGGGNNHVFAYNTLKDLCWEVRDSGAFYVGRSWVHRGMMLYNNTFRNVVALEPTFLGSDSVQAMYFDDQQSGVTAQLNTCENVHACFLIGGGRDNTVANNTCIGVKDVCIHFDNRGMNWQHADCTNSSTGGPGLLVQQLEHVHYQQPPYSTQYPRLPDTMSDRPCVPVGNLVLYNRCCNCTQSTFIDRSDDTISSWGSYLQGNTFDC